MISERQISRVIAETDMDRMQAVNHLRQRYALRADFAAGRLPDLRFAKGGAA